MPSTLRCALVALVSALLSLAATAAHAGQVKVALCHVTGSETHPVVLIEVAASAVEAHLAHDDFLAVGGRCSSALPDDIVPCGGFGGLPCPPGTRCFDIPGDDCDPCTGADCPGFCGSTGVRCDPTVGASCPPGLTCIDDPLDECHPDCGDLDCPTVCAVVEGSLCEGIAGFVCPPGFTCADSVGDACHADCGGADCGGVCVLLEPVPCGGPDGLECPGDMICVPDTSPDCCRDGDCPGVCVLPLTRSDD